MNERNLKYSKKQYITVIRLYYGCTTAQAEKFYDGSTDEVLEELYEGYVREAQRNYYTDQVVYFELDL